MTGTILTDNYPHHIVVIRGNAYIGLLSISDTIGIRPVMNLKQNVIITGGLGTKEDPFTINIAS